MAVGPAPGRQGEPQECGVCRTQFAKYTCPRCSACYCSLRCYKAHGSVCTEAFYRRHVEDELRVQEGAGAEDRRRVLQILQRQADAAAAEDDEDDRGWEGPPPGDPGGGLSRATRQRIDKRVEAAEDLRPEDLSAEERAAFHAALRDGSLAALLPGFTPWWARPAARELRLTAAGTAVVTAVPGGEGKAGEAEVAAAADEEDAQGGAALPRPPAEPLPPLAALTRAAPSPRLRWLLLGALYAYCLALRLYGGDWEDEQEEAAAAVLAACPSLAASAAADGPPESAEAAVSEALAATRSPALLGAGAEAAAAAVALLGDVAALLELGRPAALCCLAELQRLFGACRSDPGQAAPRGQGRRRGQGRQRDRALGLAARRLTFLLSWANEQPPDCYSSTHQALAGLHRERAADHAAVALEQQCRLEAGTTAGVRIPTLDR